MGSHASVAAACVVIRNVREVKQVTDSRNIHIAVIVSITLQALGFFYTIDRSWSYRSIGRLIDQMTDRH
jgi:hypothetical protein